MTFQQVKALGVRSILCVDPGWGKGLSRVSRRNESSNRVAVAVEAAKLGKPPRLVAPSITRPSFSIGRPERLVDEVQRRGVRKVQRSAAVTQSSRGLELQADCQV